MIFEASAAPFIQQNGETSQLDKINSCSLVRISPPLLISRSYVPRSLHPRLFTFSPRVFPPFAILIRSSISTSSRWLTDGPPWALAPPAPLSD